VERRNINVTDMLSNPRHERFAQLLAQGKSAVEAYELAGYRRDDGNAVRLTKKPAITDRVQELTGLAAEKTKITVESLIAQAEEVRQRAMESKQFSVAVAAIKEIGVLSGVRVERKEVGQPGEFDHLSDEELERDIIERFAQLARDDPDFHRAIVERFRALGLTDAGSDTTRH
jgi:hypothetical protein